MYLIYQNGNGEWILRLRAKTLKVEHSFRTYYGALKAVQLLQLHLNKHDRHGRVFRQNCAKAVA